jgi:hypothetical protein
MNAVSTPYQEVVRDVTSWFKGNPLSFAIPIVGGPLLFAAQCLGAAKFDTYQARVIFLASNISDALRALVLLFLPFTIQTIGYFYALVAGHYLRRKATRGRGVLWLVVSLAVLAFGAVLGLGADAGGPISVLVLLAPSLAFLIIAVVLASFEGKLLARIYLVIIGAILLFAPIDPWLFSSTVWLPLERFSLANDAYLTGYLLHSSDGTYLVLIDDSRQTVLLDADAVKTRTLCYAPTVCADEIPSASPS